MPNEADMAQEVEAQIAAQNEAKIEEIKNRTKPQKQYIEGSEPWECVDCGEEIPEIRARKGRIRCVKCQQLLEQFEDKRRSRYDEI